MMGYRCELHRSGALRIAGRSLDSRRGSEVMRPSFTRNQKKPARLLNKTQFIILNNASKPHLCELTQVTNPSIVPASPLLPRLTARILLLAPVAAALWGFSPRNVSHAAYTPPPPTYATSIIDNSTGAPHGWVTSSGQWSHDQFDAVYSYYTPPSSSYQPYTGMPSMKSRASKTHHAMSDSKETAQGGTNREKPPAPSIPAVAKEMNDALETLRRVEEELGLQKLENTANKQQTSMPSESLSSTIKSEKASTKQAMDAPATSVVMMTPAKNDSPDAKQTRANVYDVASSAARLRQAMGKSLLEYIEHFKSKIRAHSAVVVDQANQKSDARRKDLSPNATIKTPAAVQACDASIESKETFFSRADVLHQRIGQSVLMQWEPITKSLSQILKHGPLSTFLQIPSVASTAAVDSQNKATTSAALKHASLHKQDKQAKARGSQPTAAESSNGKNAMCTTAALWSEEVAAVLTGAMEALSWPPAISLPSIDLPSSLPGGKAMTSATSVQPSNGSSVQKMSRKGHSKQAALPKNADGASSRSIVAWNYDALTKLIPFRQQDTTQQQTAAKATATNHQTNRPWGWAPFLAVEQRPTTAATTDCDNAVAALVSLYQGHRATVAAAAAAAAAGGGIILSAYILALLLRWMQTGGTGGKGTPSQGHAGSTRNDSGSGGNGPLSPVRSKEDLMADASRRIAAAKKASEDAAKKAAAAAVAVTAAPTDADFTFSSAGNSGQLQPRASSPSVFVSPNDTSSSANTTLTTLSSSPSPGYFQQLASHNHGGPMLAAISLISSLADSLAVNASPLFAAAPRYPPKGEGQELSLLPAPGKGKELLASSRRVWMATDFSKDVRGEVFDDFSPFLMGANTSSPLPVRSKYDPLDTVVGAAYSIADALLPIRTDSDHRYDPTRDLLRSTPSTATSKYDPFRSLTDADTTNPERSWKAPARDADPERSYDLVAWMLHAISTAEAPVKPVDGSDSWDPAAVVLRSARSWKPGGHHLRRRGGDADGDGKYDMTAVLMDAVSRTEVPKKGDGGDRWDPLRWLLDGLCGAWGDPGSNPTYDPLAALVEAPVPTSKSKFDVMQDILKGGDEVVQKEVEEKADPFG